MASVASGVGSNPLQGSVAPAKWFDGMINAGASSSSGTHPSAGSNVGRGGRTPPPPIFGRVMIF